MLFVRVVPGEVGAAAATEVAGIGEAHAVAVSATTGVVAAAEDEVSMRIAAVFSERGQAFQVWGSRASAFHEQFVKTLTAGADLYGAAEAANTSPLQPAEMGLLDVINAPFVAYTGRPLIGDGADEAPGSGLNGGAGGLFGSGGGGGVGGAALAGAGTGGAGGGGAGGLLGAGGTGGLGGSSLSNAGGVGGAGGAGGFSDEGHGGTGGAGGAGGLFFGNGGNGGGGGMSLAPGASGWAGPLRLRCCWRAAIDWDRHRRLSWASHSKGWPLNLRGDHGVTRAGGRVEVAA